MKQTARLRFAWLTTHRLGLLVLASLAYVPALASSPGRMPADTKLYLYLDPGGLLGRASSTFEPDQFAGWVPHQQITYLWPSGPWFWFFDTVGVPDWIAHRLWIGTILFVSGAGVLWLARRLGLTASAALAAALVYQLSPLVLPYISRTSLLLLPWAGLGWIVGLTMRAVATHAALDNDGGQHWATRWRDPALIALIVATVGSANATALIMIVPAPALWLLLAARSVAWRASAAVTARTTVLCLGVSMWWFAMLVVQSRNGSPVLSYSETLVDVSRNSTGSEVLRGLGYWLGYVRDPVAPTTTAVTDYLISSRVIALSFAVTLFGLLGLTIGHGRGRRFAALCVGVGAVVAVGVHPFESPSPLMALITGDDGGGIALALRSSTRALPVMMLGVALGTGLLVSTLPGRSHRVPRLPARGLGAGVAGLLAVANLPALWTFALVDDAIDRGDPPAAWIDGAAALDASGSDARVLQLPGSEFGAYRWGFTVDQPLVGLTEHPLITRDLLPLGSAGAMDLLYALDDRVQEGTLEPASVAPIARLLGADTVWLTNDLAFERFRTPRPAELAAALTDPTVQGLGDTAVFGEPQINVPDVPMVNESTYASSFAATPLPPVTLIDVDQPAGIVRAKSDVVLVAGSGDGVVDAAAAGLLDGHELIRYTASLSDGDLLQAAAGAQRLLITDSNRDRAHHWRGSQDVVGHTEPGGPADDVLTPTVADQRLAVFDTQSAETQTIAMQEGPVQAIASSYGEPFAYRPEDRAVMAIDGDPNTAWLVGDHGNPVGESIQLTLSEGAEGLVLRQPAPATGGRQISRVRVTVAATDGTVQTVDAELDDRSTSENGQTIENVRPAAGAIVTIEIVDVTIGDQRLAASRSGVGFAEIDFGIGPTIEIIRTPLVSAGTATAVDDVNVVLTRLRADPGNIWRSDPEPNLHREFSIGAGLRAEVTVTLRLDQRATDRELAELFLEAGALATTRLVGGLDVSGNAAVDGDLATAWFTPFDGAVGSSLEFATDAPLDVLQLAQPTASTSPITRIRVDNFRASNEIDVPAADASGISSIVLPNPLEAGTVILTIVEIDERTTVDRRYGDTRTLPAAISELSGSPAVPALTVNDETLVRANCRRDLLALDDQPLGLTYTTTIGELRSGAPIHATVCDDTVGLTAGSHRVLSMGRADSALTVDRVVFSSRSSGAADPVRDVPMAVADSSTAQQRTVVVSNCLDGCWLVSGDGFNTAWNAEVGGQSLGPPQMVDGGFNGWWIEPAEAPVAVSVSWTAQRPVTIALALSALIALGCLGLVALATWRERQKETVEQAALATDIDKVQKFSNPTAVGMRRPTVVGCCTLVAAAMLIAPLWAVVAAVPVGAMLAAAASAQRSERLRRLANWRVLETSGLILAAVVAGAVVWTERRTDPIPNAGWTESFTHLNGLALMATVLIAAGPLVRAER